jgi:molybdenum cofactor guanylyltransferase
LEISCIVLAGGQSTRLGRDKTKEVFLGKTLLERVLDTLSLLKCEIIIVTTENSSISKELSYPGLKFVNDIFPGKGSLGGIYTGLVSSKSHYNLVTAADMPFMNLNLIKFMIDAAEGYDLVAYLEENRPELLLAVYSKNCLIPMENLIRDNNLRIIGILPYIKVRYLESEEVDRFDPHHFSFFNNNTEADLIKGIKLAKIIALNGYISINASVKRQELSGYEKSRIWEYIYNK